MISSRHRFHSRASVQRVYRLGKVVRGTGITLKYTIRSDAQPYRAAVVVSKKVHKSAVVRNRIRRRIYEIIRRRIQPDAPYDTVFTVYIVETASQPAADLEKIVTRLLTQATVPLRKPTVV